MTEPTSISDVSRVQSINTTPMGYVLHVVAHLDDRTYCRRDRPVRPYSLSGWSAAMLAAALKNAVGGDKHAIAEWRAWIREVRAVEMANEDSLSTLLRALRLAGEEKADDYARLIRAYICEEYAITGRIIDDYYEQDNKQGWIRAHANTWPGPGNDWRDPVGAGRID
jgi:hypothetical protein